MKHIGDLLFPFVVTFVSRSIPFDPHHRDRGYHLGNWYSHLGWYSNYQHTSDDINAIHDRIGNRIWPAARWASWSRCSVTLAPREQYRPTAWCIIIQYENFSITFNVTHLIEKDQCTILLSQIMGLLDGSDAAAYGADTLKNNNLGCFLQILFEFSLQIQ